jgi:hypothetical protein
MKLVLLKSETSHRKSTFIPATVHTPKLGRSVLTAQNFKLALPSKICRVINESTSNEDELREKLQKLSAGDAELLRELCALFSVRYFLDTFYL